MTRNLWRCDGFRPVVADGAGEAAEIFAARLATRKYGRRGYSRHERLDHWTEDRREYTYQVFVGVADRGGTNGHREWLHVYTA